MVAALGGFRLVSPVVVLLVLELRSLLRRQDRANQPKQRHQKPDDEEHHASFPIGGETDGEDDRKVDEAQHHKEKHVTRIHRRSSPSARWSSRNSMLPGPYPLLALRWTVNTFSR